MITYLCSSASCSTSPIFCAICCKVLLKFEYVVCSSVCMNEFRISHCLRACRKVGERSP